MGARRRLISALVVAAGVVVAAWSCNHYVLGNRCGHRLHEFKQEPASTRLPPDTVELGQASQRPRCGIAPIRGFSELRLASTMSPGAVEAWYENQLGQIYGLRRVQNLGGKVSLYGTRVHSGNRFSVYIQIGTPRSLLPIFPRDAHVEIPDEAQSIISVEVGDP